MSDFGELCPLFNTGVFHEVVFPGPMNLCNLGTGIDLLYGSAAQTCGGEASAFSFGRTVIVTEAFCQRDVTNATTETHLLLFHKRELRRNLQR